MGEEAQTGKTTSNAQGHNVCIMSMNLASV